MSCIPELKPRLAAIAELIGEACVIADVGTDHAYLPVWLAAKGRISRAVASDIRPGPLARAKKTVSNAGLEDRIELVLCDGLAGIDTRGLDYAVIAGMGGETEAEILEKALASANVFCRFILQPMTKAPELRRRLAQSGFEIYDWRLAREGSHIYEILAARMSKNVECEEPWLTIGKKTPETAELWPLYAEKTLHRLNRELHGLRASSAPDISRASNIESLILKIRKELEK